MRALPDRPHQNPRVGFLGIGVQKCATSWLHGVLAQHSQIGTPDHKETDFFIARHDRGWRWYEDLFRDADVMGEFSPNYFTSTDAAMRAHRYNPDMRLIAILRDPVDRARSNHLHEIRKGHIPPDTPFEQAMQTNPAYIEQGRYARHLDRWISLFGETNCLILLAEDIAADPVSAFESVCDHLGVDRSVRPDGLQTRRHESVGARSPMLQGALRAGGGTLRRLGLGGVVPQLKSAPGLGHLVRHNKVDLRKSIPEMMPQTRAELGEIFAPDIAWVSARLKRDLPWPTGRQVESRELQHAV